MKTSHSDYSSVFRNIRKMMLSSSIAQLIPPLAILLLARLYLPRDFGAFALFQSTIALFGVLATCRYELAIVVARNEEEARALFAGCLALTGMLSALALIVVAVVFHGVEPSDSILGSLYPVRWLLPVGFCVNGLYQVFSYARNRERNFHRIGLSAVALQACSVTLSIGLGLLGLRLIGLSIGSVAGQLAAVVYLAPDRKNLRGWLPARSAGLQTMVDALKKYKRFAVYNVPYSMIGYLTVGVPVALLLHYGFSTDSGFFSMARRMLYLPATLLGVSLSQVLFEQAAAGGLKTDRFAALFRSILTIVGQSGALIFVFFCIWAPILVPLALGKRWEPGVPIMIIFAPCAFSFLNASWIDRLYDAAGMQRLALLLLLISTSVTLALFLLMLEFGFSPAYVVGCYSLLLTVNYLYYTFVISRVIGERPVSLWPVVRAAGLEAGTALVVFGLIRLAPVDHRLGLAMSLVAFAAMAYRRIRLAIHSFRHASSVEIAA
jgi:O-antigen/teichoic acid export membrane protein